MIIRRNTTTTTNNENIANAQQQEQFVLIEKTTDTTERRTVAEIKNDNENTTTTTTTTATRKATAFVPLMAFDDFERVEPLVWCGAELTQTLSGAFTVTAPRFDDGRLQMWATQRVARPQFMVTHFAPARSVTSAAQMEARLTPTARRLVDTPNAGGNSALSEAVSYELLHCATGAQLDRAEMEIAYWCCSKITDYSVRVCGVGVGVSVTRACKFRGHFTLDDAEYLLRKKLFGVNESSAHVITPHQWRRQVLHIFVQRPAIADQLAFAYARLPLHLRADTLVMCTVVPRQHRWLFFGDKKEK